MWCEISNPIGTHKLTFDPYPSFIFIKEDNMTQIGLLFISNLTDNGKEENLAVRLAVMNQPIRCLNLKAVQ